MCGILFSVSKKQIKEETFKEMLQMMHHRGPDGDGYYVVNSGEYNLSFGHKRLAINDLSERSNQPLHYQDKYTLIFNGEIYNFKELRSELESLGYSFTTESDTEVLLLSYVEWGEKAVERFNGMWAFIIYNSQDNSIFVSRDRFGIKPLYYYQDESQLILSSEIKAIHKYLNTKPNLNYLKRFIKEGALEFEKETAFTNIFRYPFGHYSKLELGDFDISKTKTKYWDIFEIEQSAKSQNDFFKQYRDLLLESVEYRLRSDVTVGAALSGGLDSSSIVSCMSQKLNKAHFKTFSSVYKTDGTVDCDESYYIDLVKNSYKEIDSQQIEPKANEVKEAHRKVIYHMENPLEGLSISGWHTFKLVKQNHIKVNLDGQGADEMLAGYIHYLKNYIISSPKCSWWDICRLFMLPNVKPFVLKASIFRIIRNIIPSIFFSKLVKKFNIHESNLKSLDEVLKYDFTHNLVNLLHYMDSISMANSVESRVPFLDYRLVQFAFSLSDEYKIKNGWTKYIAREAFKDSLPHEIVWRKEKLGWPNPEKFWLYGALKTDTLDAIKNSNLLAEILGKDVLDNFELESISIKDLIRYLNIAVWEDVFFRKWS